MKSMKLQVNLIGNYLLIGLILSSKADVENYFCSQPPKEYSSKPELIYEPNSQVPQIFYASGTEKESYPIGTAIQYRCINHTHVPTGSVWSNCSNEAQDSRLDWTPLSIRCLGFSF